MLVKLFLVLSDRNSDQLVTKKHIRTQDFLWDPRDREEARTQTGLRSGPRVLPALSPPCSQVPAFSTFSAGRPSPFSGHAEGGGHPVPLGSYLALSSGHMRKYASESCYLKKILTGPGLGLAVSLGPASVVGEGVVMRQERGCQDLHMWCGKAHPQGWWGDSWAVQAPTRCLS